MSNITLTHHSISYKTGWTFDNEVYVSIVYGKFTYSDVKPIGKEYEKENSNKHMDLKNNLKLWDVIEENKELKVESVEVAIFYKDKAIIQKCADDLGIKGYYGGIDVNDEDGWEPFHHIKIDELLDILNWARNYKHKEKNNG